jgi:hypothetical protein
LEDKEMKGAKDVKEAVQIFWDSVTMFPEDGDECGNPGGRKKPTVRERRRLI